MKKHLLRNYTSVSHVDIQCLFYCTIQAPKEANGLDVEYFFMPPLCCTTTSKYLEEFSGDGRQEEELGVGGSLPFFSSRSYLLVEFCSLKSGSEPVSFLLKPRNDLQIIGMFYLTKDVTTWRSLP